MLHSSLQQAIARHWRTALMATASVGLSACGGSSQPSSSTTPVSSVDASSSIVSSVSSVAPSSSSVAQSSSSVVVSSSEAPSSSSVAESSSSVVSSSSMAPPATDLPYTITKIGCNDPDDYTGRAAILFDGSGAFNGQFFNKEFNSAAYANLARQGANDYSLQRNGVNDPSCDNRKVHEGTWLKKLVDTDGQHSNGFSTQSVSGKMGDIDSVVLELRINSDLTDVPTQADLLSQFESTIGADGVAKVDNGKINFAITLGDPDANNNSVRGEVFIELDQDVYADQWVRISIPKNGFYFWSGANWEKTAVSQSNADNANFGRLHLNPETLGNGSPETHGYVVRNAYGYNEWTTLADKPEEDFKEMNISIRTFEVRYEPTSVDGGGTPSSAPMSSSSAPASSSVAMSSSSAPAGVSEQERAARVAAGKALYEASTCSGCHGADGTGGPFGPIVVGITAGGNSCDLCNNDDYDGIKKIIEEGKGPMPACTPAGDCAAQLADYVWNELNGKDLPVVNGGTPPPASSSAPMSSSSAPAEPEGVSEQERAERVAAGKALYEASTCSGCHGADGTGGPFGPIVAGITAGGNSCDLCNNDDYDGIKKIIEEGKGPMPACTPAGDCAAQIADYVWNELNGKDLPVVGGSSTPPATGNGNLIINDDFEGQDNNSVPAGWKTFLQYQIDMQNNNSSNTTFALIDSSKAHSGSNSVRIKTGGQSIQPSFIFQDLPDGKDAYYTRFWMNIPVELGGGVKGADGNHVHFMSYSTEMSGSNKEELRFGTVQDAILGAFLPVSIDAGTEKVVPTETIPANQWVCLEFAVVKGNAIDKVYAWMDDQLLFEATKAADWARDPGKFFSGSMSGVNNHVTLGWRAFGDNKGVENIWFDDIAVSTEGRIGCN